MEYTLFFSQMGLSLIISLAVIFYLRGLLYRVLVDLCKGHAVGAEYWIKMLDVMMVIAPLILVILFSNTAQEPFDLLRRTLAITLIGQFISLSIVGRKIHQYSLLSRRQELLTEAAVGERQL